MTAKAFSKLSSQAFARMAESGSALVLDARRKAAFAREPRGIRGAVPLYLDAHAIQIPDCDRSRPIAVYCVCDGDASSVRVALWLIAAGYEHVTVLEGGLPTWREAGFAVELIDTNAGAKLPWQMAPRLTADAERPIAEQSWLAGESLPVRRKLAVLFVDIVDSTSLIESQDPKAAFEAIQEFMTVVVEEGVAHCGDVRDFEGDGALLYFAGVGEALPAAFAIRDRLNAERANGNAIPEARFGLAFGELLAGYVGNHVRRSLLLVGPAVHAAARLQKIAKPGQIATACEVLDLAAGSDPDLVAGFEMQSEKVSLKGFKQTVSVWTC